MAAHMDHSSWPTLLGVAACSSIASVLVTSGSVSAVVDWCLCQARALYLASSLFATPGNTACKEPCCRCACHSSTPEASPTTPRDTWPSNAHGACLQPAGGKRLDPFDPNPRANYMPWEDYFMAVAHLSAQRSKDPNKQVGACIVSHDKVILGIGYNGFPRGCPDSKLPWAKKSITGDQLETKYPYVCHAEMNAIMNKNAASLHGAKMYVTMFPCNECAKLMIQAGISEVVFQEAKVSSSGPGSPSSASTPEPDPCYKASMRLLELAGVKCRQLDMKHSVTVTAL